MLTEDQKRRLEKQSPDMLLSIMHECAGILAVVPPNEYAEIMCVPKRTVYQRIKTGNLKSFSIHNHKYPVINI